jgi:hypothetical protein
MRAILASEYGSRYPGSHRFCFFRAAFSLARCSASASPSSRAYDCSGSFFESQSRSWSKTSSFNEWCTHLPCRRPPCPIARPLLFGTLFRARVAFLARLRLSEFFFFESHSRSSSKTSSFNEWCTHLPCRRSNITLPHRLLFGTLFRARVAFLARLRLSGFQVLLRESFFAKLVEDSFFFFARRTAGARASRAAARLAFSRAALAARVDCILPHVHLV